MQNPVHTYKRYRTLQTHVITALPVVILMPHSACNCRCVMCDIWKGNNSVKQLTEADIAAMLHTLKKLGTQQVLMSGGEALLHQNFFRLCAILKNAGIKISLHTTGLLLQKHSDEIIQWVDDVIISLDGDPATHNTIRNIPAAFEKMAEGINSIKIKKPGFKITGRSVIHKGNYKIWPQIIDTAKAMQLDRISFLPADVSSHAFNREIVWDENRRQDVLVSETELPELKRILDNVILDYAADFVTGFVAETPEKLNKIYEHYAAFYDLALPPYKKCNAPWVSVVVEADGTVRPCFFHKAYGNIKNAALENILNGDRAVAFRKNLDINSNSTCVNCVCYLNLTPGAQL